jgi:hypothetical protein
MILVAKERRKRKGLLRGYVGEEFGCDFEEGICAFLTDQLILVKEQCLQSWTCDGGVGSECSEGVRCRRSYERVLGSQGRVGLLVCGVCHREQDIDYRLGQSTNRADMRGDSFLIASRNTESEMPGLVCRLLLAWC